MDKLSAKEIAGLCDHTFLLPTEAFRDKAQRGESPIHLRREAFAHFLEETKDSFLLPYAVCVPSADVFLARRVLPDQIYVAATVGFPDGSQHSTMYKLAETRIALDAGATEIDMVLNYDALKKHDLETVTGDIQALQNLVTREKAVLKVILEICELNLEQTQLACEIAEKCGVAFVKTSTGFGSHGATIEHLKVMRKHFSRGIKISGGVQPHNLHPLLVAASLSETHLSIDPNQIRIGESSLLSYLTQGVLA